ncbi:AraC-type DNA-binding protein [Chitinophaga sp. CF118]|uniref:helix-turn-helix domain-containing protein n=1 Tax=Chitinophaga sp. CF118 TaxID=1884367 RepID=UPI0008F04C17|nr:helix-turn-helix domain-containing protein [Chitinophaga sp. CF118]SFD60613.1 AraC-type DNA-binding protein [Chitinophaga sp. CF118]
MSAKKEIEIYDPNAFTDRFMEPVFKSILKPGIGKFFIVRVEDMYRHVTHAVPASRGTTHSCLYLTEGEAIMKIGSECYTIHKDEMLFVPAGQVFSFEPGQVNKGYFCNFHSDILAGEHGKFEFLQVWGNPLIRLDVQRSQFVLHLFRRMLLDYTQDGAVIQPYLVTLLSEVKQSYQPLSATNQPLVNRFKELIFSKIKILHQVSDYASLLNITPNHLNKTVKAITGKSPTKWIDEAIVQEAKALLTQSDHTIREVANEVGFEDPSYFTRLFKKYEGIPPSDFRKMIEKS